MLRLLAFPAGRSRLRPLSIGEGLVSENKKAFRIGGDEFIMILKDADEAETLKTIDIWKKNIKTSGKLITALVVFLTSWLGFLVYVLFARNRIEGWFK